MSSKNRPAGIHQNTGSISRVIVRAAAIFGATGIAAGAFGAHGLKAILAASDLLVWQTAVQYQLYHSLALLVIGLGSNSWSGIKASVYCWVLGMMIFSGSLYALALGAPPGLGLVTPLGGLLLIAGWLCLGRLTITRGDNS